MGFPLQGLLGSLYRGFFAPIAGFRVRVLYKVPLKGIIGFYDRVPFKGFYKGTLPTGSYPTHF